MWFLFLLMLVGLVLLHASHKRLARRVEALAQELERARYLPAEERPAQLPAAAELLRTPAAEAAPAPAPPRPRWSDFAGVEAPPFPPSDPTAEPAPERQPETLGGLFERFVGGRLLIWTGGVALAVAGVLLVRYSIELGLMTPRVRMLVAAGFGLLLIGAGEAARWRPGLSPDVRIAQALVGAGILVLYAAAYGSHILYQLIGLGTCSTLMALITAGALGLSLRHGAPTAVMGLIGGFATPVLVGNSASGAIPLLAYLALLDTALFALAYRRGWTWLAAAAAVLSFLWTAPWLVAAPYSAAATGVFVVGLAVTASLLRPGEGRALGWTQPAAVGLLQLAVLVVRDDLGLAGWGLYGALAAATLLLATLDNRHRPLPAFALALALFLLFSKAALGSDPHLPYVAAAIMLLFGSTGWWRSDPRLLWVSVATAALALPPLILRLLEAKLLAPTRWGILLLVLAALPAALAWRQRKHGGSDKVDVPMLVAASGAALLAMAGVSDLVPERLMGSAWLIVALAAAWSARQLGDRALTLVSNTVSAVAIVAAVASVPQLWTALVGSLVGEPPFLGRLPSPGEALARLGLPALLLAAAWRLLPHMYPQARTALAAVGALFAACVAYVLFKQIFGISGPADFVRAGFAERMAITQGLFLAGWLLASRKLRLRALADVHPVVAAALTAVAAARLIWFDLLLHNPVLTAQAVGSLPVLNLLLPQFIGAAFWLYAARRRAVRTGGPSVWMALFLIVLIAGVMLLVRQAFQGPLLNGPGMPRAEFYGYSLAGLMLAVALLVGGVRAGDKALRLAGLALLTATALKVFLVDADVLEGVLRILSFLGLGVALIGIGKLYGKVLRAERPAAA
jgi:uncharacterized membrane protein